MAVTSFVVYSTNVRLVWLCQPQCVAVCAVRQSWYEVYCKKTLMSDVMCMWYQINIIAPHQILLDHALVTRLFSSAAYLLTSLICASLQLI